MLIRHEKYVGFRCLECSNVTIKQISIFDFSGNKKVLLTCICAASYIEITDKDDKYMVSVPCSGCGERHCFYVKKASLWNKDILAFHCPVTALGLVCIGDYEQVVEQLDEFDSRTIQFLEAYHLMTNANGQNNYANENIMFDVIEYLYSLIFSGKVRCECGKGKLDLQLESDRVILKCHQCGRQATIMTDSEEAFEYLCGVDEIFLS